MRPIACAAFRLMTSSNRVGCSIGKQYFLNAECARTDILMASTWVGDFN